MVANIEDAFVTEEKGTDVSLGAHLVFDACHNHCENSHGKCSSFLIFQTPVDMAISLGKKVIVVNPHRHQGQSDHLFGNERRKIQERHLKRSQFSSVLEDSDGRLIKKPN